MRSRYHVGQMTFPQNNALSRRQRSFLDVAVRLAESSELNFKHGAVIVKGGSVLSVGVNKWRNLLLFESDKEKYNEFVSVHAEIDALARCKTPQGATMYIARVNKDGEERISRPCSSCTETILNSGIKKVIYTA